MKKRSNYWQLLAYLRPQWRTIVYALMCAVIFAVTWPAMAFLSEKMSRFISEGRIAAIAETAGYVILIWGSQKLAQYGQETLIAKASLSIAMELRNRTFSHIQRLSLAYFETVQTGDLTYRLTEDVDRIGEVIQKLFSQFVPNAMKLVVTLITMLYFNWQLTLSTLIVAPLLAGLTAWFGEKMRKLSYRSQSRISDLSALLTEMLSGVRLVRAFAAEDYAIEQFRRGSERNRQARYATERLRAIQYPVQGFLDALGILALLLVGSWQISQGNLTGSEFIAFVVAVAMLFEPISTVTLNYNEFKQGEASVDRVFELLQINPSIVEQPDAKVLPSVTGRIEFENVSFAYRPDRPVLQDLSLRVYPGEMVALVGASGAGKTTLVNLIPRFYDPQAGEIWIDGTNIRDVSLKSLRHQIGIVPQETILFTGTIAQNIAFGQLDFDMNAVREAAKIANAHQFISQFPDGYETWVGERGVNLSGGQRQRLAIARAVLLNPRILILDEATSALDSESEALVQEALERIMQGRTVFIIAHRLATVRRVDRILVMEKGRVVESGTHTELLAEGGRYARFYAQQFS
ncbi:MULTISPECIES: ABC transporter ATP-binding protein [Leptolyngbya]|uniref:ABC transporter ATP-binding protein n=1 Tax=Leptolyngbya boryana CZ1 TaxID=3060204 RepID=A0AA96WX02_LEPBY|nr:MULTISPECIES: ABC transporter ATP-binding protein [Leptolyngbya]MBD1857246.1 ABC transporter ATP-binding protein [Leptolyngbya sp. FACHB-1624]MBD2367149.1 ABC transporter ATP-binding protein [Leptolyngbya sp. FACHB-161]MBD2373497.1 ABC transporter ATP-binding protein [Leptolyngbya sp. FACHB-238]MBD2397906.1 ABC transporter ATP-binding protein [Leptolyngbya sp. FACHB-239]MBD2404407.1 ABC transporter ATP-binding protein [Leptolyngbya sp. FACHB-402]